MIILPVLVIGVLLMSICCSGPSQRLTEEQYAQFEELLGIEDYEAIDALLTDWEKKHKDDAQFAMCKAIYLYVIGQDSAAQETLAKGIELHPDRIDLRMLKAEMYLEQQDIDELSSELICALERSVENDNKWYGDYYEPEESDGVSFLRVYIQSYIEDMLEFEDLQPLENLIDATLRLYPDDAVFMSNVGELKSHKGDLAGSLEAYLTACEMAPDDPVISLNVANMYAALDDVPNAVKYYLNVARSEYDLYSDYAREKLLKYAPESVEMRKGFFGFELRKKYEVDDNEMTERNVSFYGYDWDFLTYTFSGDSPKVLSDVTFLIAGYQNKEDAAEVVAGLISIHVSLYGEPSDVITEGGGCTTFWEFKDEACRCAISMIPVEFEDGKEYWNVGLVYVAL